MIPFQILRKDKNVSFRINCDVYKYTNIHNEIQALIDKTMTDFAQKHNCELTPKYRNILQGELPTSNTKRADK